MPAGPVASPPWLLDTWPDDAWEFGSWGVFVFVILWLEAVRFSASGLSPFALTVAQTGGVDLAISAAVSGATSSGLVASGMRARSGSFVPSSSGFHAFSLHAVGLTVTDLRSA